jgi:SSS family solute:Na+ symporter
MLNLPINIETISVISYLLLTLILGLKSGRKVKNFKEYAIGDRNLPTVVIGMTISATLIGGGSSLGTSTEVFKYGIIVMVAKYGVSLGALLTAFFIIPKMNKFFGKLSVGEIMGELYGQKVRMITGVSGALLCIGRVAAQIMALGFVMRYLFDLPQEVGAFCGAVIIIAYSCFGGVRSVVFTDVLQFIALAVTIPLILNIGLKMVGGYDGLLAQLPSSKISLYPNDEMFRKYFIVFLYMSIPMLSPPLTQRILMSKSVDQAKKSFIFLAVTDMIFTTVAGLIGLVAFAINSSTAPNGAFLNLINELGVLHIGLKAIAIIGILSVIMSTIDSYLNTVSTSIVNDVLLQTKIKFTEKTELYSARLIILVAGILATVVALYFENIFELAIYCSNFWGSSIVAPLLLGIFSVKISSRACMLSMVCGLSTFLLWEHFNLKEITQIYSIIPSILSNTMILLLASLIRKK